MFQYSLIIMPSVKIDYKKDQKGLYSPSAIPSVINIPRMRFISVKGKGSPGGENFNCAVSTLYSAAYTIKMKGKSVPGYAEFTVPPLEGLWTIEGEYDPSKMDSWMWTLMIRMPDFVTDTVLSWTKDIVNDKPGTNASLLSLWEFDEGMCVQSMHIGSYDTESETYQKIVNTAEREGYIIDLNGERRHHEIYLSDPEKTEASKLKTILRLPVKRS